MPTRHYLAVADRLPDEACWSILFPAFPGVTSVAERFTDVLTQARDALAAAVDDMLADGEALPPSAEDGALPPYDRTALHDPHLLFVPVDVPGRAIRVNISLDEGLLGRLDEVARRTGHSRSSLLARGARLVIDQTTDH